MLIVHEAVYILDTSLPYNDLPLTFSNTGQNNLSKFARIWSLPNCMNQASATKALEVPVSPKI